MRIGIMKIKYKYGDYEQINNEIDLLKCPSSDFSQKCVKPGLKTADSGAMGFNLNGAHQLWEILANI